MRTVFNMMKAASLLFFVVALSACTVQLAPQFDQRLYHQLLDTSANTLIFLAETSSGTRANTCEQRQNSYFQLIGQFEALALQSRARPMPDSDMLEKINAALSARGLNTGDMDEAASAAALDKVASSIAKMQEQDCANGLQPIIVATFKNEILISLDQAITYESFLER
uniref:hypothetical protein n=1 Tax=Ningiella ruwaisensis TaxID=2364274 RepID=UPI00109FC5A2|nr:hypothetical protein [Ningiella ruwaisensis]